MFKTIITKSFVVWPLLAMFGCDNGQPKPPPAVFGATSLEIILPPGGNGNMIPFTFWRVDESKSNKPYTRYGYEVKMRIRGGAADVPLKKPDITIRVCATRITCPCSITLKNIWACNPKGGQMPDNWPGLGMLEGVRCPSCQDAIYHDYVTDANGEITIRLEMNTEKENGSGFYERGDYWYYYHLGVNVAGRVEVTGNQRIYNAFKWYVSQFGHCNDPQNCSNLVILGPGPAEQLWPNQPAPNQLQFANFMATTAVTSDPCDACGANGVDSDNDGTPDCRDQCPGDPKRDRPGICGCGGLPDHLDTDRDEVLDCFDGCPKRPGNNTGTCLPFDADNDGAVDQDDFAAFQRCYRPYRWESPIAAECEQFDWDRDGDVDPDDLAILKNCVSGPAIPADPNCSSPP